MDLPSQGEPTPTEYFADDAFVNDARCEFWGKDAIGRWLDREVIGNEPVQG